MRTTYYLLAASAAASLAAAAPVSAAVITLYNSGVDNGGAVQANGSSELHFAINIGAARVGTSASGYPIAPFGPWIGDNTTSAWIGPVGSSDFSGGPQYDYTQTFSLAGLDPTTAKIFGQWASDDTGSIYLNGVLVPGSLAVNSYTGWSPFSITGGFVSGTNTLTFRSINSGGGPTGIRVEMRGVADLLGKGVPEPSTWLLMSAGFALLGATLRRKRDVRVRFNFA